VTRRRRRRRGLKLPAVEGGVIDDDAEAVEVDVVINVQRRREE
jgi:hypothetical protein